VAKFIWVQDLDFIIEGGGAQNTDRAHFTEGIRRGHNESIVTPQGNIDSLLADNSPVIISNMMAGFSLQVFQQLVERNRPCIWFFHDYQPLCKYRLFYPMLRKCKTCYRKNSWLPILLRAKLLIWLSSLHRESWLWSCPELEDVPYAVIPSPVDPNQFYDLNLPRDGVVSVSSLFPFKGRENILRWATEHPEVNITFISGNPLPNEPLPPNCQDIGPQPFSLLNEIYNRHKTFLHLPGTPQPFERSLTEAYLAGCDIIGNKLIGALSYNWFKSREEVVEHCSNSSKLFWGKIEEVLST